LLLVAALVVRGSLRPMVRLAGDLDLRRADDMTPLPLAGTPANFTRSSASINGLLERMKLMMDQQRVSSPMRRMNCGRHHALGLQARISIRPIFPTSA